MRQSLAQGSYLKPCTATRTKSMGLPLQPSAAQEEKDEEAFSKGCGSKRKAEEDGQLRQEAAAAVVIREQNQGADAATDEMVAWGDGYDYDSDDDVEAVVAKVKARFDAVVLRNRRWLQDRDDSVNEGGSVHDDDDGAVVDGV